MKIDDLEAFLAVVRCQSLSLAAEALRLTQSAITRRVQNFEDDLGAVLLDRTTKPLKPTTMGQQVYQRAQAVMREIDGLRELVSQDSQPSGVLRLGVPQTLGDAVLLEALQTLKRHYPELQVQVMHGWGGELVKHIETRQLDAAAALFPPATRFAETVGVDVLAQMPLRVVAASGVLGKRRLRLADCQARGWVLNPDGCGFRGGLARALAEQGLALRVNLEIFGTETQLALVAGDMGLGLVPEPLLATSRYRERLDVLTLGDFKPLVDLCLVRAAHMGNLQGPVELFGSLVTTALARRSRAA